MVLAGIAFVVLSMFVFKKAKDFSEEFQDNPVPTMAKTIAALNPEIDYVGSDDENETVTFLNKKTGEEITVDYQDVKQGRLTFTSGDNTVAFDAGGDGDGQGGTMSITTAEGSATYGVGVAMESFPDWVPVYPGSKPQGLGFAQTPQGDHGSYSIDSDGSLEVLVDYYVGAFEKAGLKVISQTTAGDGSLVTLGSDDSTRGAAILGSTKDGKAQVVVSYNQKKE